MKTAEKNSKLKKTNNRTTRMEPKNINLQIEVAIDAFSPLLDAMAERMFNDFITASNNETHEEDDEILDTEGAARMIRKSKGQIYQWVNSAAHGIGNFPYMKAGRSLRFSRRALLRWMSQPK